MGEGTAGGPSRWNPQVMPKKRETDMGLRGPKPLPPEIKALKGNPGKRRLALSAGVSSATTHAKCLVVEPPHYLTEKTERDAFNAALAALPANVVRGSDTNALARWAVWLNIWVQCKSSFARNKT